MHIESIRIENFRSFSDETIPFNPYTCLVGSNGSGKSNVLCALNIFFRETAHLSADAGTLDIEDFHLKDTTKPVRITVTFSDLSAEALSEFSAYVRHGKLIITAEAVFNPATQQAEIKQHGQRLAMAEFKEFFGGDKKSISELKKIYETLRASYGDLPPPGTKDAMSEALKAFEAANPDKCVLIPSEDQFYGFSKGSNKLAKFVQWVYVPAVKDATHEQVEGKNTALGKLLARTVRAKANFDEQVTRLRDELKAQYQILLDSNQSVLDGLSASLQSRLAQWAHPKASLKLEWRQDGERSVRVEEPWAHIIAGEGAFEGNLSRFGHGLQRSYLLSLLHELAISDGDASPKLILGCEEPELFQHPPQARHLASVFSSLSNKNAQIIVTTHSPHFVSGEGFEDVRMVRKCDQRDLSRVGFVTFDQLATDYASATGETLRKREGALAKIHPALQPQLNEMFFTRKLVLVEGLEDIAYITTYLQLLGRWDEFRAKGFHVVSTNGKSEIIQPLLIARRFGIPTFTVFDSDAATIANDGSGRKEKHIRDNNALLTILNAATENAMPTTDHWGADFVMWHGDIGKTVADELGTEVARFRGEADALYGQAGSLKKNPLHIGAVLSLAWDENLKSPSLIRLCDTILNFSEALEEATPGNTERELLRA